MVYTRLLAQARRNRNEDWLAPSESLPDDLRAEWMRALGTTEPASLDRRLAWDGLDPKFLGAALTSATGAALDDDRLGVLRGIADAPVTSADGPRLTQDLTGDGGDGKRLTFVELWRPAADWAAEELRQRLRPMPVGPRALADLTDALVGRLCAVGEQALSELFAAERPLGSLIVERLVGGVPAADGEDRARSEAVFVDRHRRDGLDALFREFPVLGRHVATTIVSWRDANEELFRRVEHDRPLLDAELGVPRHARLESIAPGAGDPHRGGRATAILDFDVDGATRRVVYKPRSMALERGLRRVLSALGGSGTMAALATARVCDLDAYGYMEYVVHRPAESPEELERFYYNAGRLAAVLYVLGCTDCHHGNLVARGDQLIPIDAETLLEPMEADHAASGSRQLQDPDGRVPTVQSAFDDSVLRTGLFPSWTVFGVQRRAADLTALGVRTPAGSGEPVTGAGRPWDTPGALPRSLPVGSGRANPLRQYRRALVDGFRDQAADIVRGADDWLGPNGYLAVFADLSGRCVLRATHIYFAIQLQQLRANALRSERAQAMVLEQLARLYLTAPERPRNWPVLADEIAQMEQLDIPYFEAPLAGTTLSLDRGRSCIAGYFETSSLQAARRRVETLGRDIELQVRLIDGAIDTKELELHSTRPSEPTAAEDFHASATEIDRLDEVQGIVRRLIDASFRGPMRWIGADIAVGGGRLAYQPLGTSLSTGAVGIALLFAGLGCAQDVLPASARIEGLDGLVDEILQPLVDLATAGSDDAVARWWRDQPLGLAGAAGQLLVLVAIDELQPDRRVTGTDLASRLVRTLHDERIADDPGANLLYGAPGLIGPLLRIDTRVSIALATRVGDRLVERLDRSGRIAGFRGPTTANPHGFSTGPSGVVATLARLAAHTGDGRFDDAAGRALDDLWDGFGDPGVRGAAAVESVGDLAASCCHGLSGTALGRLALLGTSLWDDRTRGELVASIDAVERSPTRIGSLCCAAAGTAAVLRIAHATLGQEAWAVTARRLEERNVRAHRIVDDESTLRHPLRLGFMNGLSGVGFGLLDDHRCRTALRTLLGGGLLYEVR